MKKNIYVLTISMIMIFVLGCGASGTEKNITDNTIATGNSGTANPQANIENDPEETSTEQEEEPEEYIEPSTAYLSMKEAYNDTVLKVACTGLAQYDEISSGSYCDTPKAGNIFVVAYLNIENYGITDIYFSAESLKSSVDQKDISHTILVNDPEGYPTIFKTIPAGGGINGYIVWEVPKDWKELSFIYTGWQECNSVIFNGTFTPADLCTPIPYDQL